jgi:MFS family permease
MAPQALASIHAIFPAHEKGRALSLYGATFGLASVGGQLLGGVLVAWSPLGLGWRSVFLINLPIIFIAVPAALMLLRESRAERTARLDIIGALLLASGLLAVVVPLIEGRERGWPWWCVTMLVVSVPILFTFWRYENHLEGSGKAPLVLPSLLLTRGLPRSLAATFLFYALAAFFLVFAVYEQVGLGHNSLTTGLAILPLGVGFFLGPLCGPQLARLLSSRSAALGMALEVAGLVAAAFLAARGLPTWLPIPLFVIGLGQGIALPALVRLTVEHVDTRWAGLAAGLVSATLQISAAVSVALIGGLFFTLAPDGASASKVQAAFAVASLTIGLSLALSAGLSWKRSE